MSLLGCVYTSHVSTNRPLTRAHSGWWDQGYLNRGVNQTAAPLEQGVDFIKPCCAWFVLITIMCKNLYKKKKKKTFISFLIISFFTAQLYYYCSSTTSLLVSIKNVSACALRSTTVSSLKLRICIYKCLVLVKVNPQWRKISIATIAPSLSGLYSLMSAWDVSDKWH